jgi:dihydrofolate synthase/folylpolyglutamate synthase
VVDEGFGTVRVPGRLEVVGRRPLLVLDGAHNVAGMTALGLALADEFAVEGNTVAVVGMLSGRDPSAMLAALAPAGVATVVACPPDSPRALPVAVLAEAGRALGLTVLEEASVHDALAVARGLVNARGLIVVTGSMYTVGAARGEVLAGAVRWEDAGR